MHLPSSPDLFTDVYFLRSRYILEKEQLNPYVRAQIFIRSGPGYIAGIDEALAIIRHCSNLEKKGGRMYTLSDGDLYEPCETIMIFEGRILDIITLETIVLGVISARTTKFNDRINVDLTEVASRIRQIVQLIGNRPVLYFGARHWQWDRDAEISKAAFNGGATDSSTDIGAAAVGKTGVGTIPHSLECIFAWKYGNNRAVVESIKAFDRHINPKIPRIARIDFANREIDDALSCAKTLGTRLYGVRVDTCKENYMQGAKPDSVHVNNLHWYCKGISIAGVWALRKTLNAHGFHDVKIVLSSGFGDREKVKAFVESERELGIRLFDILGVGEVFHSRSATMDIVGVGDTINNIGPIAKAGRVYNPNPRLKLRASP